MKEKVIEAYESDFHICSSGTGLHSGMTRPYLDN